MKAAREMRDFKIPMQTWYQGGVAFVDMEFMEVSGFCQKSFGGEKGMISDGVFSEETGRFEDQFIMSWSTLEYLNDNWSTKEKEFNFETLVKVVEWRINGKYTRMIARLPIELAWAYHAEERGNISFRHYEVSPLVPLTFFVRQSWLR